jgi:hypothetical protein
VLVRRIEVILNPLSKNRFPSPPSPLPRERGAGGGVRAEFMVLKTGFGIKVIDPINNSIALS